MYIHSAMYIIERSIEKLDHSNSITKSKGLSVFQDFITRSKARLRDV